MKTMLMTLMLLAAPICALAEMPRYTLQILASDGTGFGNDEINNRGEALVGTRLVDGLRANLVTPAGRVDLGTLGGTLVRGMDINDAGWAVGSSTLAGNDTVRAFLYADGQMRDIGTLPGGHGSDAVAINNAGTVVGSADVTGSTSHAFLYTVEGGMVDLGTMAGGDYSSAQDVSEAGEVLGIALGAGGEYRQFLYKDGVMSDIADLGIPSIAPFSGFGPNGELYGSIPHDVGGTVTFELNLYRSAWRPASGLAIPADMANGYMVGYDERAAYSVLATADAVWRLDELAGDGWRILTPSAVNDQGQVVAWGCNAGLELCATVLLSPVPEPATYGMLGLGLGVVALARRRKAATASRSA